MTKESDIDGISAKVGLTALQATVEFALTHEKKEPRSTIRCCSMSAMLKLQSPSHLMLLRCFTAILGGQLGSSWKEFS
jgi:hypothetical protein